jgi:hypothetical protein
LTEVQSQLQVGLVDHVLQPQTLLQDPTAWQDITRFPINCVHAKSSAHHPQTQVQMAWHADGIALRFEVQDQYVICKQVENQGPICTDSCVEAFFQPVADKGYFNFEMNMVGKIHASYITDNTRTPNGFAAFAFLTPQQIQQIQIIAPLTANLDQEITEPIVWSLTCWIPLSIFEDFLGPLTLDNTTQWKANFYKCADHSSHPHWLSWQSVGENLSFHKPETFGTLVFS